MRPKASRRRAPAIYRAVLRLYPRSFRGRAGAELERIAEQLLTEGSLVRVTARLLIDAAAGLPGAWLSSVRPANRAIESGGGKARGWVSALVSELKYAVRRLSRSPGYTLASIGTLAIGIGATTAIWAVVDAALLRPLPYEESDQLVVVTSTRRGEEISVAFLDLVDWQQRTRTLEGPAGFVSVSYNLTGESNAIRVRAQGVTSNLFSVLRAAPVLGRTFTVDEDVPGAPPVAVLSHSFWRTRYGSDAAILDRTLVLNDVPFTVVGVMPDGFAFPDGVVFGAADLWVPAGIVATPNWRDRDSHPGIIAIGRMRPGETLTRVREDMDAIASALAAEHPGTNAEEGVLVKPAIDVMVGDLRDSLYFLTGAVGLLLLIACANVASLSLVRAMALRREVIVRATLGAGRTRIAFGAVGESMLLAVAGGAAGLLVARASLAAASSMMAGLPRLDHAVLDGRVLAFAAVITLATGILFGLLPALRNASEASGQLRSEPSGTRVTTTRARGTFVVAQVALALMLLVSAGALVRSFVAMQIDNGGIRPEGVITFTVRLPERYEGAPTLHFYDRLATEIVALPGVRGVGGISTLPFSGAGSQSGFAPAGTSHDGEVRTDVNVITPNYFDAMGVDLLRGRSFQDSDRENAPTVVIVDELFAQRFWPGQDPIGRRVQGWGVENAEIIGVVRHVKNYGVTAESRQELYMPHAQRPFLRMTMMIRADDPASVIQPVRSILQRLDAELPIETFAFMTDIVAGTIASPRLAAFLSATFALLATMLAAIGLYGVISYSVTLRIPEIGTRMALGALPSQVLRLVSRQAFALAVTGITVGVLGVWATGRLLESMVFRVSPRDPLAILTFSALLLLVTAVAAALPAARAARVSPHQSLRQG